MSKTTKTRYNSGGMTETNAVGMGFWTRRQYTQQPDDIKVVLTELTAKYPNLLTKRLYGKDSLVWLLLQYNNIIDPIEELVPGKEIRLPKTLI